MGNCKEICSRWNITTLKRVRIVLFFINTLHLHLYNGISVLFYNDIFHTHISVSLCNNIRENHCVYIYISQTLNYPKIYYNFGNAHNDKYSPWICFLLNRIHHILCLKVYKGLFISLFSPYYN